MTRPPGHAIVRDEFAADVRAGLSKPRQKELYSKYFYDDIGSALFEVITLLPEYGLTRAEMRLLQKHAPEVSKLVPDAGVVAELGPGSGAKARVVLNEVSRTGSVLYRPIDVSRAALSRCQRDLDDMEAVKTEPIESSYIEGLRLAAASRPKNSSLLVLFLGSSIGNFEPKVAEELLRDIRALLTSGDVLYLSTDLVKDTGRMISAYDDPLGVTAAFNLNLLGRINRELDGSFDLRQFRHVARYDEREQRIEMHLRSMQNQTVRIGKDMTVRLQEGETIWSESSYKFRCDQVRDMARSAGFQCRVQWVDDEWPFAQSILHAQ
jgi:dimethylhistidine N-methyltransferase